VSEAVDELASALAGLAELGLASTGLGATSVAELGLATSDPVTGLALATSGLRMFSTGAAGLAGSTVSAATWPCARKAKRTAVEILRAFVYKRFL
jgi:hypothetical protein